VRQLASHLPGAATDGGRGRRANDGRGTLTGPRSGPILLLPQPPSAEFAAAEQVETGRPTALVGEGLRRQDLIRHGRFIERALAQGALAQPHHVLFPIPLAVILEGDGTDIQNCGYSNATSDCYDYNQR
jgi:hypothetical protein